MIRDKNDRGKAYEYRNCVRLTEHGVSELLHVQKHTIRSIEVCLCVSARPSEMNFSVVDESMYSFTSSFLPFCEWFCHSLHLPLSLFGYYIKKKRKRTVDILINSFYILTRKTILWKWIPLSMLNNCWNEHKKATSVERIIERSACDNSENVNRNQKNP